MPDDASNGKRKRLRVLLVDDDPVFCRRARTFLREQYDVTCLSTWTEGRVLFEREADSIDIVLLDYELNERYNGLQALEEIRRNGYRYQIVLIVSAYLDGSAVPQLAREFDADGCLSKLDDDREMARKIVEAIDHNRKSRALELRDLEDAEEFSPFIRPVFESDAMRKVQKQVERFIDRPITILITGESGVGKGVFAQWIHRESNRRDGPWLRVDLKGRSREMFEATLRGHEKGAFTGADAQRYGVLELAHGGTMMIDEIGEFDDWQQKNLLDILEHKPFMRIGGKTQISPDVRYLCATNRDLEGDAREGRFRADLLSRLKHCHIELPPLRERCEDIPRLAEQLLRYFCDRHGTVPKRIDRALMDRMRSYPWPRNMRQLAQAIEAGVLHAPADTITLDHVEAHMSLPAPELREGERDAAIMQAPLKEGLRRFEIERIEKALRDHGGRMRKAAEELGMPRESLYRRCRQLGVEYKRFKM